ncbi:PilZ domain-containing protein [Bradyrhizobium barranii]|uniref:PilZ domain-containing protein n=1 Tax=Bradyrhizobium TaxID=374 RepID=UPI003F223CC4
MIERRAMKRIPINRAARLSFGEIHGTHPCLVRDINALGARISTPYYIFADEFVLSFDGHSGIFYCRVVWKKETLCGVLFLLRRRAPKAANDSGAPANVVRLDRRLVCRVGVFSPEVST